jgi:hypothetical protein
MTLSDEERADFIGGYTRALINAWSTEEFAAKLDVDPKAALVEVGIVIPDNSEVRVDRGLAGPSADNQPGSLEDQVQMYDEGRTTGVYRFSIPADPQIETNELSEEDLAGMAAGTSYCCSCCTNPCCSCA